MANGSWAAAPRSERTAVARGTTLTFGISLLALLVACGAIAIARGAASRQIGSPAATAPNASSLAISQDRAAESELRNALVAAKTMYTDSSSYVYADASGTGLVNVEPSLCYVGSTTPSAPTQAICDTGQGDASISVFASSDTWAAARMSGSGTCYWIKDAAAYGTSYGSGFPCTGEAAVAATFAAFPDGG